MSFEAPARLALLLLVPAAVAGYVAAQRQRARRAQALATEGLVTAPASSSSSQGRSRHIPFAFFVAALAVLVVALARPSTTVKVPHRQGTVILALDVSNSMRATDVKPSRLAVAKAAAKAFVERQPPPVRIGVIAFGTGAVPVQAPTTDHAAVLTAIDHVSVGGGTALGQGLLQSLDTIAGKQITIDESALQNDEGKVDIGYYGSASVVALSDGENTNGPDPLSVARVASAAGVRVHALGVGTEAGTVVKVGGYSIATALDSDELKQLASLTDGTYHTASDAAGLASVARSIRVTYKLVSQHTEVTAAFSAAALALLVVGAVASVRRLGRIA